MHTRLRRDTDLGDAPEPVQIGYGLPAGSIDREFVLLGNTRPEDGTTGTLFQGGQASAALGGRAREERYVLESIISVVDKQRNRTQQQVTERAFEVAGHIEASLRDWETESGPSLFEATGVRWAQVTALTHQEYSPQETGERSCWVFMDISVSARI